MNRTRKQRVAAVMTATARKALKASIKHWERLVSGREKLGEGLGPSHCPLCKKYIDNSDGFCGGCPVAAFTNSVFCDGSPHEAASSAHYDTRDHPFDEKYKKAWIKQAGRELAFLKKIDAL